eukprot:TRINITY_DN75841_c0_g1_i1.p1 TRINITY_DN75841_c0_g1~~TRINITY_DN75841_c0_g1_i1.p1  ORF type:complete len:221 (-),score=8.28 TRINITY_DN75841_c0_g1_i1:138-800(-)
MSICTYTGLGLALFLSYALSQLNNFEEESSSDYTYEDDRRFVSRNCEIGVDYQRCCSEIETYWALHRILWERQSEYEAATPRSNEDIIKYAQLGSRQTLLNKTIGNLLSQCEFSNKTRVHSRFCFSKMRITTQGINYELPVATCGPISCSEEELRIVFNTWIDCETMFAVPVGHCVYIDRWKCSSSSRIPFSDGESHAARLTACWLLLVGVLALLTIALQ